MVLLAWRVARPGLGWPCIAPNLLPPRLVLAELLDPHGRERLYPQLSVW